MDTAQQNSRPSEHSLEVLQKHWVLVSTIGAFLFVSLKLSAISGFNFTTATALVTSGALQVLMGILFKLITTVPLYIGIALLTMVFVTVETEAAKGAMTDAELIALVGGLAFTLLGLVTYQPWGAGVSIFVYWLYYIGVYQAGRSPPPSFRVPGISDLAARLEDRRPGLLSRMLTAIGNLLERFTSAILNFTREFGFHLITLLAIGLVVFSPSMWLPAERITTARGQVEVGYFVSQDDNWTTILTENDRRILRVKSDSITDRHVCELATGRSILQYLFSFFSGTTSSYPSCIAETPS